MVVTSSSATSDAEAVSYSRSDGERCGCRHERRTDGRINARSPGQARAEMAACNRDADVVASVIDVRQGRPRGAMDVRLAKAYGMYTGLDMGFGGPTNIISLIN